MTFGASCICLCSFHLGFLPFPFFHFPPWLYAVSSGPFPEFSEISNLFSMAFPFLGFLAVLPPHPSTLVTFKLRSFLWSRSYISSYLSAGNSFTLLFYTFFFTSDIFCFSLLFPLPHFSQCLLYEAPLNATLSVTILGSPYVWPSLLFSSWRKCGSIISSYLQSLCTYLHDFLILKDSFLFIVS